MRNKVSRHLYVQLIEGTLEINDTTLSAGMARI
ncbi:MAG: hypothetical protein ACRCWP_14800 [Shewanella sp.]